MFIEINRRRHQRGPRLHSLLLIFVALSDQRRQLLIRVILRVINENAVRLILYSLKHTFCHLVFVKI